MLARLEAYDIMSFIQIDLVGVKLYCFSPFCRLPTSCFDLEPSQWMVSQAPPRLESKGLDYCIIYYLNLNGWHFAWVSIVLLFLTRRMFVKIAPPLIRMMMLYAGISPRQSVLKMECSPIPLPWGNSFVGCCGMATGRCLSSRR